MTSLQPSRKRRLTCSSCLTTTSPCPSGAADTVSKFPVGEFAQTIHRVCLDQLSPERDGMLRTVIERAGFKELFESSRSKADAVLAKVPSALSHFALDALFERPVQAELVELLLLPKEAERFTSCVLVHGMGGTGKVSGSHSRYSRLSKIGSDLTA